MQTPKTTSKIVLVKPTRGAGDARRTAVPVRRFRIARMPIARDGSLGARLGRPHSA